ncbi:MAG: acyl-CoA dehydrogenase family protein [Bacteroidetes bacterium]|nr:acyl-CoA dehydrogenase family protein [Bacteroidota bacterium]
MIPRTLFSEEHNLFRESSRKFLQKEIVPYHEQWEQAGMVSREAWLKAGKAGFLCTAFPEEYGGSGADFLFSAVFIEELARTGCTGPGFPVHSDIVAPYILHYGTQEQKKTFLPKMASGEIIGAIAMSEPNAGSDLQAIKTTARKEGGEYIVNGSKTFITNGFMADMVIVAVKTDTSVGAKGMSLLLVEAGKEGFTKGRPLKKIGMKAQDTCEMFFDNVRVPVNNLLGREGEGFKYLMQQLPQERLVVALMAISLAEAAFEITVQYTKERSAFGKTISEFQNTRFKLAEMAAEIQAGRTFADRCLDLHLNKGLDAATASMAKYFLTELQCKVVDECVQLHGGYGYMWDYFIARAYADSRAQKIYAGSNEIMKEIIAREVLK